MPCVVRVRGLWPALVLCYSWASVLTGTAEPMPRIDGQQHSAITLQENATRQFSCQSEGWPLQAPPLLTWYLNGEEQGGADAGKGRLLLTSSSSSPPREVGVFNSSSAHNSTFTLRARKSDRELACAAADPRGRESYNATVLLNVQFQPEIVQVSAQYTEPADPGLSLVLFALVRSNPPATITWVDQSGQLVTNTSDFLILDSRSYPWLTNHTLRVTLSSLSGNVSLSANNSLGVSHSSITLRDFLQSHVEVPVLGILAGGALGFIVLLILSLLLLCVVCKKRKSSAGKTAGASVPQSESSRLRLDAVCLPRENMSLPSNLQLNDLSALCRGQERDRQKKEEEVEKDQSEQDLSAMYAIRGLNRFPMMGYIYKASSMSSDEIWL
uniref:Transmembrane protein 25 n=1 Tax=Lepisosteus oculatus TaxID=7918 RepID=W5MH27_LEPOC|nr:PREDICTED: transmembrane protein 25 isoform X1 [Lepisosteus oculatus]XP_015193103.1 PREDICTED: transmembrane protein 25 isoform X1 [Lepisosteus oculatus]XP_015193104.1 PREDICTED: transmembrane protein 25 isoform X1 [Lepisosteus oculatus]